MSQALGARPSRTADLPRPAAPSPMDEASLDEVFESDYEHIMRQAHPCAFNRAEAELAARVLRARPGMPVLDAACGYGRISVELAERGLRVHGVDRSATLVASARAEAARRGCAAEFDVCDLRRLTTEQRYDAAVLWFTSFGYTDDADSRTILRNIRRSLRPGGRLVIDTVHPVLEHARAVAENPRPRLWRAGRDLMLDEVSLDSSGDRITARRTVLRDGRARECRWSLRLLGLAEYEQWLRDAGFARVQFLGGDGEQADWTQRRLLVLAHAPGPHPGGAPRPDAFTGCTR